jgi:hypothetical protein
MGKEIVLRYVLAVLFGCVSIAVMTSLFDSTFKGVASTSLFACIASVANEDESLGPVLHKGLNRFGGACLGGFFGMYDVCVMYVCINWLCGCVHRKMICLSLGNVILTWYLVILSLSIVHCMPAYSIIIIIIIICLFEYHITSCSVLSSAFL